MKVMKFGGSSLADAPTMEAVGRIVQQAAQNEQVVVVCSAMKGITDKLIQAALAAEDADSTHTEVIRSVREKHERTVGELMDTSDEQEEAAGEVAKLLDELESILHGVELVRECTPRTHDLVMSFGELLSSTLLARFLRSRGVGAKFVDARRMIITDSSHGSAHVDRAETYRRISSIMGTGETIMVVPGFIAADAEGVTTTLGRNGSDFTASLVGAAVAADEVQIWTDVDGIMSADPRSVEQAFVVSELSYEEAMELSYFGAEVIHPYTMLPVVDRGIPIRIKNTMDPEQPGTLISVEGARTERDVTGIASIDNIAIINVEGGGMVGVPGIAHRIFRALASANINIIMISQASSEHTICLALRREEASAAVAALESEFATERKDQTIRQFELQTDLEIVAVIGERMRGKPGVSGRLFGAMGRAGLSVHAIAQGSSERNISFIVAAADRDATLRTVHDAFFGEGTS